MSIASEISLKQGETTTLKIRASTGKQTVVGFVIGVKKGEAEIVVIYAGQIVIIKVKIER